MCSSMPVVENLLLVVEVKLSGWCEKTLIVVLYSITVSKKKQQLLRPRCYMRSAVL